MSSSLHKRLMQSGISAAGLPPKMPGSSLGGRGGGGGRGRGRGRQRDYTPVKWDVYFERQKDIKIGEDTFVAYESGSDGPVLVLLHGGGFSGLTWSLFAKDISLKVKCR